MKRELDLKLYVAALVLLAPGACTMGRSTEGGSGKQDGSSAAGAGGDTATVQGYPIDSQAVTTVDRTIEFASIDEEHGLPKVALCEISRYDDYGYGDWEPGDGLPAETRFDIMPPTYRGESVTQQQKLLRFFAFTDVHITDEESPSQLIYLQQLRYPDLLPPPYDVLGEFPWAWMTSTYSPVMLYTTQVLDAAVQTVNAMHQQDPIDFGLSLGDSCNSAQRNELRWYIDVLDGKVINPSSGAHAGAENIDYQKPFKAAGLDKTIPWYQTMGNHDHFWMGSLVADDFLQESSVSDTVLATGDLLVSAENIDNPAYYMGVLDGSTPTGEIVGAGPVEEFSSPPKVVADPERRSLLRTEWLQEFFATSSEPAGHGFAETDADGGFACYSFVPKSDIPIKVIVLDDTQRDDDGDTGIHGHGFLDDQRYEWLKRELADGDANDQLMIIGAHIPIGVERDERPMGWWLEQNAVTLPDLLEELQSHPNLLMWVAGHRHVNTIKAFKSPDPIGAPEKGFWQVETSSLRDFPQQFRTFEIYVNSDYSISIVASDVDPAVKEGTPAAKSREYAVATYQITLNNLNPNYPGADPTIAVDPDDPEASVDPSIRPMLPSNSYNATLYKHLSPRMVAALEELYPNP